MKICDDVNPEYNAASNLLVGVNNTNTVFTGDEVTFTAGNSIEIGPGFNFQEGGEAVFYVQACEEERPSDNRGNLPDGLLPVNENDNEIRNIIEDKQSDFDLKLYPNPTSSFVNIENPNEENGEITVYNSVGAVLTKKQINASETIVIYLPISGIYFVRFSSNGIYKTYKLIHD